MKFALCLIVAAAALDTQPPVIKLDLDQSALVTRSEGRKHLPPRSATGNGYAESSYVHSCVAKKANKKTCPLPQAKAYDHHDGVLGVTTAVYLVNNDKTPVNQKKCSNKNCIDYQLRSEWVVKYDAADAAGNAAEQVVFAIILNDPIAPEISAPKAETIQSMSPKVFVVPTATATDNYDAVTVKTSPKLINTYTLGKHVVTFSTHDNAGMFGYKGKNNQASKRVTYTVVDTTKPVLSVPSIAMTYECNKSKYTPAEATCADTRDGKIQVAVVGTVDTTTVGAYPVSYDCKDSSNNKAATVKKAYATVDKTVPVLTLSKKNVNFKGIIEHHAGEDDQAAKIAHINKYLTGYSCKDACDGDIKPSATWFPAWNARKVGTYVLKYGCVDASKNSAVKSRTVINVDIHEPTLNLVGSSVMSVEASKGKNFEDPGAKCVDKFEGDISASKVSISGTVDRGVVGTYILKYACKDTAGNAAPGQTRTVVVFDDVCPTCTIYGANEVTREASFPYADDGAKCSDIHDGATAVVTVGKFDVEKVGVYKITYRSKDAAGNWNDAKSCKNGAQSYVRTVTVKDTLKPVISLSYGNKAFHKSAAADKGSNGQANPAKDYFMEESQTSVNGWIVGAIASAVAGVALLSMSTKKTVTSVPV